ncbi:MAG: endonuclease/exonuclease/phosphatase family protein [Algiphilus sp.]
MMQKEAQISVLTLNMHKGFSAWNRRFVLHDLRDAIRRADADVVLLQEVLGAHYEHSTRWEHWPEQGQYEFLADTVWSAYAYGRNAVYSEGHHGNAILSKFPILHWYNHDVSTPDAEKRGLLHCQLAIPGWTSPLHAVCVHLGLREAQRRDQIVRLCAMVEGHVGNDTPLLIAGDFNDWRGRVHAPLTKRLGVREVFVERTGRAARTFPAWWPLLRLDRVYLRNLSDTHAEVLHGRPWRTLSDHAPLTLDITTSP